MKTSLSGIFRGMIPAIMTPFKEDGTPDFRELKRKALALLEAGAVAVVYCGSMGEWSLLTTAQRKKGVATLVRAGIPVIVGTGAQNTEQAADIAAHARKVGAAGLMIIPRQSSLVKVEEAQEEHFTAVLKAGKGLPSVVYNSPYYGFSMLAGLFNRLRRKFKHLVGFKEFGGAKELTYDAINITSGIAGLALLVGVDTQVYHGYVNCGAVGAITGIGNVLPREVLHLIRLCQFTTSGKRGCAQARRYALELSEALNQLSLFDEGPKLVQFYKYLLTLNREKGYKLSARKTDRLTKTEKAFAKAQFDLFNAWWADWDGKEFFEAA
jgi:dihydrodipicolinate synthase/N-acetylneuraminate lyase